MIKTPTIQTFLFLCFFLSPFSFLIGAKLQPTPPQASSQTIQIGCIQAIDQNAYERSRRNKLNGYLMCGFFAAYNAECILNEIYARADGIKLSGINNVQYFNQWLDQRDAVIKRLGRVNELHEGEIKALLTTSDDHFYTNNISIVEEETLAHSWFKDSNDSYVFIPPTIDDPLIHAINSYRTEKTSHIVIVHVDLLQHGLAPHWIAILLQPDGSVILADSLNLGLDKGPITEEITQRVASIAYLFNYQPLLSQEELARVHSSYWKPHTIRAARSTTAQKKSKTTTKKSNPLHKPSKIPLPEQVRTKKISYDYVAYARAHAGEKILIGVNLCGANLSDLNLEGVNFSYANLQGAKFVQSKLNGALFIKAKLDGANFTKAHIDQGNFTKARLNGTLFIETRLRKALFRGINTVIPIKKTQRPVRFDTADLTEAVIEDSLLAGAIFNHATLTNIRLSMQGFTEVQEELQRQAKEKTAKTQQTAWRTKCSRSGYSAKDIDLLVHRASHKDITSRERKALMRTFKGQLPRTRTATYTFIPDISTVKTSFPSYDRLISFKGTPLQQELHQQIVEIAIEAAKLYNKYVLEPLSINKIWHVTHLNHLINTGITWALDFNQQKKISLTYEAIAFCNALKEIAQKLAEFFDEHQPSFSNGCAQLNPLINHHTRFIENMHATLNYCSSLRVNITDLTTTIKDLLTKASTSLLKIIQQSYPSQEEFIESVMDRTPLGVALPNESEVDFTLHVLVEQRILTALHRQQWDETISAERKDHFCNEEYYNLTHPITSLLTHTAQAIRSSIQEARERHQSEYKSEEMRFLQKKITENSISKPEKIAITKLLKGTKETNSSHFFTIYHSHRCKAPSLPDSELDHLTGSPLQIILHTQLVDLVNDNKKMYEEYVDDRYKINKNWHIRNLQLLMLTGLEQVLYYNKHKKFGVTYNYLGWCKVIKKLQQLFGEYIDKHQASFIDAVGQLCGGWVGFWIFDPEYIDAFGNDIKNIARKENDLSELLQQLKECIHNASSSLCQAIEKACSRQASFINLISKHAIKTPVQAIIDILNEQKAINVNYLSDWQHIIEVENNITRYIITHPRTPIPTIQHELTRPVSLIFEQTLHKLQQRVTEVSCSS